MPGERQKDQPLTPYQQTQNLVQQFGSIAKIPNEELSRIGFRKADLDTDGYNGLVRIKPVNIEELPKKTEKINNAPFERIDVDINTTPEGFRRLQRDIPLVSRKLRAVRVLTNMDEENLTEVLGRKFELLVGRHGKVPDPEWKTGSETDYSPRYMVRHLVFQYVPEEVFGVGQTNSYIESNFNFENYLTWQGEMSSIDTRQFHTDLERCKAQLGDPEIYKRRFDSLLTNNFVDTFKGSPEILLPQSLTKRGLSTGLGLTQHAFSELLQQEGFEKLGEILIKARTEQEVIATITSFKVPMTAELTTSEKELKAKLKAADKQDRPLLAKLNDKLRSLQGTRRERLMLLEGMLDYYRLPEIAADIYRRRIKAVQDLLVSKGDQEDSKVLITLDGTPDPVKDLDPGTLSGDCTAGSPLPFNDPNIPVYNVKVFQNDAHIGNIYLLYSHTSSKKPVWHLEAIQIPRARLDWHAAIPAFIDGLLIEATKKGVEAITINKEDKKISNYDYISKAALEYAERSASSEYIDIPNVTKEGYSSFQSTGSVYSFPASK